MYSVSQSRTHQSTPHQVNSLKRVNVFQKSSSSSDYSTTQTSPLFYPLYSHRRHCPTEMCCKLPRLLVPPHVTVSSLKPFHLFLLGLTLLCKSEIAAKNATSFPINFLWVQEHSKAVTYPYYCFSSTTMLRYKRNSTVRLRWWLPLGPPNIACTQTMHNITVHFPAVSIDIRLLVFIKTWNILRKEIIIVHWYSHVDHPFFFRSVAKAGM